MFSRLRSLFSRKPRAELRDLTGLVDKEALADYFDRTPEIDWPVFVVEEEPKLGIAKPALTKKPGAKKSTTARKRATAPKTGSTKPKAKKSTAAKKTASKRVAPRASTKKTTRAKPRRKS